MNIFSHGSVRNYWGGLSSATTHLLAAMHYRGMLRIVRRESGIRVYAVHEHGPAPADAAKRRARIDALVDAAIQIYAPLPGKCLGDLVRRLRFAVPQWQWRVEERHFSGPNNGSRIRVLMAWTGIGRRKKIQRITHSTIGCVC